MNRLTTLLAGAALCLAPAFAQNSNMDMLNKHWKTSAAFTMEVAKAMPAESYDFKPAPEEMSFGELMAHIAQANAGAFARASGQKNTLTKPAKLDKDAVIKYMTDSFAFGTTAMGGMTDADLAKMVGPEGKQMTAGETLWAYFTHTAHHRGQAEVYLRVKGIKPPTYVF